MRAESFVRAALVDAAARRAGVAEADAAFKAGASTPPSEPVALPTLIEVASDRHRHVDVWRLTCVDRFWTLVESQSLALDSKEPGSIARTEYRDLLKI